MTCFSSCFFAKRDGHLEMSFCYFRSEDICLKGFSEHVFYVFFLRCRQATPSKQLIADQCFDSQLFNFEFGLVLRLHVRRPKRNKMNKNHGWSLGCPLVYP